MGLINNLFGNATSVDPDDIRKEFDEIRYDGETIETAFRVFRDKWVFTNRRLIILNVQGLTGKKREYLSLPYRSVAYFSVETAGTLDDDCELKLWMTGRNEPFTQEFSRNTDIKAIQKVLARHILEEC